MHDLLSLVCHVKKTSQCAQRIDVKPFFFSPSASFDFCFCFGSTNTEDMKPQLNSALVLEQQCNSGRMCET